MKYTQWVVYMTDDDNVEAIANDFSGHPEHNIRDLGGTVLGYVLGKYKEQAIKYGEQVLCPNK